jgi:nitrate reductase beta subunit
MEYYIPDKVKDILSMQPWISADMERDKKLAILSQRIYDQIDRETMLYKIRILEHINNALSEAI